MSSSHLYLINMFSKPSWHACQRFDNNCCLNSVIETSFFLATPLIIVIILPIITEQDSRAEDSWRADVGFSQVLRSFVLICAAPDLLFERDLAQCLRMMLDCAQLGQIALRNLSAYMRKCVQLIAIER